MSSSREHWEKVYTDRKPDEVSWFQEDPKKSLEMIEHAAIPKDGRIIDVGGGASKLADRLLDLDYGAVSVLDISAKALSYSQVRLGDRASEVQWIVSDATDFSATKPYDLWHDRAVFHFLTDPSDRAKYLAGLKTGLRAGGTLILAAFATDGPEKCSGLPVCRYGKAEVAAALGPEFELMETDAETHRTPWDTEQRFNYFRFRKTSNS